MLCLLSCWVLTPAYALTCAGGRRRRAAAIPRCTMHSLRTMSQCCWVPLVVGLGAQQCAHFSFGFPCGPLPLAPRVRPSSMGASSPSPVICHRHRCHRSSGSGQSPYSFLFHIQITAFISFSYLYLSSPSSLLLPSRSRHRHTPAPAYHTLTPHHTLHTPDTLQLD